MFFSFATLRKYRDRYDPSRSLIISTHQEDHWTTDFEVTSVTQREATKTHVKRSRDTLISPIILSNKSQTCTLPRVHRGSTESLKALEQIFFFKSALLIMILQVSTNTFHLTYSFCCFSSCHAPTISRVPPFCIKSTPNRYSSICSDEEITLKSSPFQSLYSGHFAL